MVEPAVILAQSGRLQFQLGKIVEPDVRPRKQQAAPTPTSDGLSLDDVKRMERDVIVQALDASRWRIRGDNGAAQRLGLKPTTLSSRMKKMGIHKP
ncbi:MAG: hypothetical protein IH899_17735 [Planctomycetes bacterium]|nr:hypothetical protein [Planctomycetota bacterium]